MMKAKRFLENRKNQRRVLSVLLTFSVYIFILTNIFAYYSTEDMTTNRISAKSIGLELYEPAWDMEGAALARRAEPGMTIPKDPFARNTGQLDEVIRLKLEIRLAPGTARLPSGNAQHEGMVQAADETQRKISILRCILDDTNAQVFVIEPGAGQITGNSIPVTGADNRRYMVHYQGSEFLIEDAGSSAEKFDFYFYYIGNNYIGGVNYGDGADYTAVPRDNTVMETVPPNGVTSVLFHKLVYPIYKKDFLTVFDQAYTLNVYAEGVLCADLDAQGLPHTVEGFKRLASE